MSTKPTANTIHHPTKHTNNTTTTKPQSYPQKQIKTSNNKITNQHKPTQQNQTEA